MQSPLTKRQIKDVLAIAKVRSGEYIALYDLTVQHSFSLTRNSRNGITPRFAKDCSTASYAVERRVGSWVGSIDLAVGCLSRRFAREVAK